MCMQYDTDDIRACQKQCMQPKKFQTKHFKSKKSRFEKKAKKKKWPPA